MKILVFSTAYYPFVGGAEVAIKEITDRLPEYEWHVITARMNSSLPAVERVFGVTVHRVGFGFKTVDKFLLPFLGFKKAVKLQQAKPFDCVWSMMASQASVAAARFKKKYPGIPLVLTLQEGDEESHLKRYVFGSDFLYKILIRPWYLAVFKEADRMTAISRYLEKRGREALKELQRTIPIDLIPNGVDFSLFIPEENKHLKKPATLITTSRLVEKNGVGDVIEALGLDVVPKDTRFIVVGNGPLEQKLKKRVQELHLENQVVFCGYKKHEEMISLLRQADIFVRPSLSEGLGISFLEAMAMGLPIVATDVGGIVDFLIDGETGLVCRPRDPWSVAVGVKKLLDDPVLWQRISEKGKHHARKNYDWQLVAKRMIHSLEEARVKKQQHAN